MDEHIEGDEWKGGQFFSPEGGYYVYSWPVNGGEMKAEYFRHGEWGGRPVSRRRPAELDDKDRCAKGWPGVEWHL